MKTFYRIIPVVCILMLSACDSFLDVNTNPNYPETTAPSALLPSIISNGFNQYFLGTLVSSHFSQQIAGRTANNGSDQFFLTNLASPFNDTYFRSSGNIPPMLKTATAEGSWYYVGAGKTLMAALLFHLTDLHGDIPYSQAYQGGVNFTPQYDSQEQVYAAMHKLLDEALVEFNKPSSFRALGSADILFAGNVQRWKRFVYGLKARQLNHLTRKSTYSAQAVLAAVDSALTNNSDDAQVSFAGQSQDANTNPWGARRNNASARTFGKYFINLLNGTTLGTTDPRLRIIAPANRGGAVNGAGESPAATRTDFYGVYISSTALPPTVPDTVGWYSKVDGVQLVLTYSEVKFIEAEAAFRAGNKTRAFDAYVKGIAAHMDKIGVAAAAKNEYLKSKAVAQDAASLTMAQIMTQKYIALFLHPEVWVDLRRHDYSETVYTGWTPPTNPNTRMMGQYPRRFLPGNQENLYNQVNAYKEVGGTSMTAEQIALTPVWWDKQ